MTALSGWLLDLYEDERCGLKLWLIGEDERRVCLTQHFPISFYVSGQVNRLRALWCWLEERPKPPKLSREERCDLFLPEPLPVLAVQVEQPSDLRPLFRAVERAFPDLTYYDADVQVQLRHAARYQTFPLAFCQVEVDQNQCVQDLHIQETRWELNAAPVPLRVMEIALDGDPRRAPPSAMRIQYRRQSYRIPILPGETPAWQLKQALAKHDPDVLVTDFGDTWLLDHLLGSVGECYEKLPLSRDPDHAVTRIKERSYFSYGQVLYRGQQVHLSGRVHIDRRNSMLWSDYTLDGILENARVTALPIQTAARVSPGTGISSMQMITALETGVLIPWHKQQAERPKSMLDLIHADSGGLVYQPTLGLHRNVAEIDFVSMYPAIMVRCDISPEKKPITLAEPPVENPGLVPQTLAPLLAKRVALKNRIPALPTWDPRRKSYKERASALKWLLVVCFGYLGYRNARFGRIEAHEAVTAGGREALLLAKEAAEDAGYRVLHMFVDCLWVQKQDCKTPQDFQALREEIGKRTGLQIALDGIYRWVAFLPSRVDKRVPVGNRYFGVFQDGTIKVRGLEARRGDTPPWVARVQMGLIEHLAQAPDADDLPEYMPGALEVLRRALQDLRAGRVPLEDLLLSQRLSRALSKYTAPSAAARAALQLQAIGKEMQPGQHVRFLYVLGRSGVRAWDLPEPVDPRIIDAAEYRKLLMRAAENIFQPFGLGRQDLHLWMKGKVTAAPLFFQPKMPVTQHDKILNHEAAS